MTSTMETASGFPSGFALDLSDSSLRADPYPAWRWLRANDPVHRSAQGPWLVTRYDDCASLLRDPRLSSDTRHAKADTYIEESSVIGSVTLRPSLFYDPPAPEGAASRPFIFTDPPDHDRLRRLATPPFRASGLRRLETVIDERAAALVNDSLERGRFDVVAEIAYPLPVAVICDLLGIPEHARAPIDAAAGDVGAIIDAASVRSFEERERTRTGLINSIITMASLTSLREAEPGEDLVTHLLGEGCPFEDIVSTTTLLLVAGHETTVNLIANSTLALLTHRDQLALLAADPESVSDAIDELLRYDPPVQLIARVALEDFELYGKAIGAGDQILLCLGSANRDEDRFPEPDRLDLQRSEAKRSLAFGSGLHYCLGAPLARLEAAAVLRHFVPHLAAFDIAEPPRWRPVSSLRSLATLRLAKRP